MSYRYPAQKKSHKGLLSLFVVIVGFVALAGVVGGWLYLSSPVNSVCCSGMLDGLGPIGFAIEKGETTDSIASRLKADHLIRSPLAFKVYLKMTGQSANIKAGDFYLSSTMTFDEILNIIVRPSEDKNITLLEGWRVEEMANKLNQDLGIDKKAFIAASKEGYMFPDTYQFKKDATVTDIADQLKATFEVRYSVDLQRQIQNKGLTADQGVILASIVEREARSDDVRTKVASILLKRWKMDMALNADATVQYAKDTALGGGINYKYWQPITQDDYQGVNSAYNTYLHVGLPPKPICNPSLSSLKAVANADPNTPYLYYYHDSAGNSYYARTLEEHTANVAKYH